jgi:alpha-L-fucosidase
MARQRGFRLLGFLAAAMILAGAGLAARAADATKPVPQDVLRKAARVRPSPQQAAWQSLEFTCFAHFGVNTFTDREWGEGNEDPKIFNPSALDARQWAAACKAAGMKLLIVTAKHHDGFCLWPSKHTDHSVAGSPWKAGKGDVVREVSDACREAGIRFGVYLSPWDRHERTYGSDAYNTYYKNQLRELLTQYGPVTEVWWDGACGEGPNGKRQVYDWGGYIAVVRQCQPKAVIFGMGPDIRWVGNEDGLARESEWSVLPKAGAGDQTAADLGHRKHLVGAKDLVWYPAECDVSIRPGWFYHASQDGQVKSLAHMLDIYYRSVGRNSVLLLNVPPDRRGLFHENDVARLRELRATLDATFRTNLARGKRVTADAAGPSDPKCPPDAIVDGDVKTYWTTAPGVVAATLEIDLGSGATFDRAMLRENIALGQRIERFALDARIEGRWKTVAEATTVGYQRLLRFPATTTDRVRLRILDSRDCPTLCEFGLFRASPKER